MKYDITTYRAFGIVNAHNAELDPRDFLDCEDEDELRDEVDSECYMSGDTCEYSTFDADYCTPETEIPEGFIEEWKKLKGLV